MTVVTWLLLAERAKEVGGRKRDNRDNQQYGRYQENRDKLGEAP